MTAPPIPEPVRIISSNVGPIAPGANEPEVKNESEAIKQLPAWGGNMLRAFVGKDAFPATNDGELNVETNANAGVVNPGGVQVYYMDIAPHFETPMHRTVSVDYVMAVKGVPVLVTPKCPFSVEDGKANYTDTVETKLHEGEVVVQRGQFHAWKNNTDEWIRAVAFIVHAKTQEMQVGDETKALEEIWL